MLTALIILLTNIVFLIQKENIKGLRKILIKIDIKIVIY